MDDSASHSAQNTLLVSQPTEPERGPAAIYLDNAATSFPKPPQVVTAVQAALEQSLTIARSTHVAAFRGDDIARRCRARLARFIGAEQPEEIIYTYSATDGLNMALRGFVRPGSHVIVSPLEHHSVMRPLHHMRAESDVSWSELRADSSGAIDPGGLRQLVRPDTSCIIINYVSNVGGTIQPVAQIGAIAEELGIPFLIDAAQATGSHPLNVSELRCSAMAQPAHKALFSFPGMGVLYLRQDIEIAPWRIGGTGQRSEVLMQPEERPLRYESGTPNVPGIVGLDAALEWFAEVGIENVAQHCRELTAQLTEGLSAIPGVRLLGPVPGSPRGHLASFTVGQADPLVFSQVLAEYYRISSRAGLHCAPAAHQHFGTLDGGGAVRLSVGYFNTGEQIEYALRAVREVMAELGS